MGLGLTLIRTRWSDSRAGCALHFPFKNGLGSTASSATTVIYHHSPLIPCIIMELGLEALDVVMRFTPIYPK